MIEVRYWVSLLAVSVGLFGCFEHAPQKSSDDHTVDGLTISSSLVVHQPNQSSQIDLTNGVVTTLDYQVVAATLAPDSDSTQCSQPKIVDDQIMMQIGETAVCKVNYSIAVNSNTDLGSNTGTGIAATSTDGTPSSLPLMADSSVYIMSHSLVASGTRTPILQAMTLEYGSTPQVLRTDLSSYFPDVPSNYTLDTSSLIVIGTGTATASGNTISFEPSDVGLVRVIYTLVSVSDPLDKEVGSIDISVTEDVNKGLKLTVPHYNYPERAYIGETIDFDVSHFVEAVDNNFFGDDFGVVDVMDSIGSTITYPSGTGLYNKQFSFTPTLAGPNWLAYQVDDYRGSRVVGTILVNVTDNRSVNWSDIYLSTHQLFMVPLTKAQAVSAGYSYHSSYQEKAYLPNVVEVATFNTTQASNYCSAVAGSLPTVAQLNELYQHIVATGNSDEWPLENDYLTSDSGNPTVSLESGVQSASVSGDGYYVTCIQDPSFIVTSSAGRPGSLDAPAIVQADINDGKGNPVSDTKLTLTLSLDPSHATANASCTANQQTTLTNSSGVAYWYIQNSNLSGGSCYLDITAEELDSMPTKSVQVDFSPTSPPTLNDIEIVYTSTGGSGHGVIEANIDCTGCSGDYYYLFEVNGVPLQISTNNKYSLQADDDLATLSVQVIAKNSYCDYTLVDGNDCKKVTGKTSVKIKSSGAIDVCQTFYDINSSTGPDISNPNCGMTTMLNKSGNWYGAESYLARGDTIPEAMATCASCSHQNFTYSWQIDIDEDGDFTDRVYQNQKSFAPNLEDEYAKPVRLIAEHNELVAPLVNEYRVSGLVNNIYNTRHAFLMQKSDGGLYAWGNQSYGGNISGVSRLFGLDDVIQVAAADMAFAALKSDKTVVSWGAGFYDPLIPGSTNPSTNPNHGGDHRSAAARLVDIKQIISSGYSFSALSESGDLVVWGNEQQGGDPEISGIDLSNLVKIKSLYPNDMAWSAQNEDGDVYTWGLFSYISGTETMDLSKVDKIYSNKIGFIYFKQDGSRLVALSSLWGGNDFPSQLSHYTNSQIEMFGNARTFAALTHDGLVIPWSHASSNALAEGGSFNNSVASSTINDLTITGGVKTIHSHTESHAYMAETNNNQLIAWGEAGYGGNPYTIAGLQAELEDTLKKQVYMSMRAYLVVKENGQVLVWGSSSYGGNLPTDKKTQLESGKIKEVYVHNNGRGGSFGAAFAVLMEDNSLVIWGDRTRGGDISYPDTSLDESQISRGVKAVYATDRAFAAIKYDGSLLVWGDPSYGGEFSTAYNYAPATEVLYSK